MLPIDDSVPVPADEATTASHNPDDPLALPGARRELARTIHEDIDAYCVEAYSDGHRNHLGASIVGHECLRYLWNTFRWLKNEEFDGRKLRLFQRGHLEESRFKEYLIGIGSQVVEFQPDADGNADKGDKQYRIKGAMGHYGGSLDGQVLLPVKYSMPFGFLSEYKTKGTGRGFVQLTEKGVQLVHPEHFAQMSTYGYKYGYKYAIYMAVNKNDDSLHVEVVKLDWVLGEEIDRRALDIVTAQIPPAKIAESPAYTKCKMCHFSGICFKKEAVEKNCRSCVNCKAIDGGRWFCSTHNDTIPTEYIAAGCNSYAPIC